MKYNRFKDYPGTEQEEIMFQDNAVIYGNGSDYRAGFGNGFRYSTIYNNRYGNGSGTGYHSGNGRCIYPSELIQYWK